jgi:hypothetical protein
LTDGAVRLAARYPRVWHVMEAEGAGEWLAETGLLPAESLRPGGTNRAGFESIDLGGGRTAILRPQQMPDHRLITTLAGRFTGQPTLWRQHVDQHVFFWAETRRRDAFVAACIRLRSLPVRPPVTLTIDTAALLERHGEIAFFATINTGSTVRGGGRARRDENTLRSVADYRAGPIAELAIRGRVDVSGIVVLDPV